MSFVCNNYTANQCFFFASRASSFLFAALLQSFDPRFSFPTLTRKLSLALVALPIFAFLLAMANVDIFLGLADTEVNKAVSWLEDARHMPATSGFSPAQWLWHWLSSSPAFTPLTEAAEKMDTVFGFGSDDWAFHWVEEMEKAASNPSTSASQTTPAHTAFDGHWPHFPNGHRSLGLAPADLLRAHVWLDEAASLDGTSGWKEDDWLRFWMEQDSAFDTLIQRAREAGHGWNIGQWLWLWVSQSSFFHWHGVGRLPTQPAQRNGDCPANLLPLYMSRLRGWPLRGSSYARGFTSSSPLWHLLQSF